MTDRIVGLGSGFWTVRGDYRIAGVLNVGTQMALIEIEPGRFIALDSYRPAGSAFEKMMQLTDGGSAVEAVLNLHPYHTDYCSQAARLFPRARFYGTARHLSRCPDVQWQSATVDQPIVWAHYADHIEFTVPDGVDLVTQSPHVHFGSVLAFHRASGTVHVDDTFSTGMLPSALSWLDRGPPLRLHPTLGGALRKERGAAARFRSWMRETGERWKEARQVCAAHNGIVEMAPGGFPGHVSAALNHVAKTLARHERRYG